MATSSKKNAAVRLIKCFCGCSEMTEEQVKRIYRLSASVQETLIDRQASQLFHRYLEQERSGDKNETEQYLDIYDKCEELLQLEQNKCITQDEIDELCDLGLSYDLEQDITRRVLTGQRMDINTGLVRIQGKCRHEIEASKDYSGFRQAILDKLSRRGV